MSQKISMCVTVDVAYKYKFSKCTFLKQYFFNNKPMQVYSNIGNNIINKKQEVI